MAKPIKWLPDELAWIKANCTLPRRDAHKKFVAKFNRQDVNLDHFKALCKRNGWLTGRTGCYQKGHVPDNKGKKMPYNAASAATQFKKGQRPANAKPVGYESITKDGYVQVLIAETNPHTGANRRYVLKHRYLWEQANGKLPKGMALKCLDGNKQNTAPENWEAVDRAVMCRLNQMDVDYDTADATLKPAILNLAKLKTASGRLKRKSREESA